MTAYTTSSRPRRSFFGLAILATIIAIIGTLITYLDSNLRRFYIFDQPKLHAIVKDAVANHGNNTEMIFDEIVTQLRKDPKVGPTLNPNSFRDPNEWVFNNAGGAMGSMYIIHASITEYLIFFGTPVGTEGHTGRHTADDYFHILTGEQRAYKAGALVDERYPAGSMHYLKRGQVKQYMMPESGCWALELAQGWIPPMLPFGLADTLFSTLDLPTFWRTAVITAREMISNLLRGKF
ncbi:Similar to S.cerevisiae protein ERG2 (C-8 sterol isomerase) [Malassezia sympodialis ATCC 42132]|uniref:C-8 sterol isomerase n=1 Tax=Malassezia sympodialis (strain ATCC 42132) TaxID=1230383 RepID=A0A1M8A7R8_MALS4|nr:Similar to S.cerevisiae protein ERG2 (C-8 sterol isomerase) [Malassezia sympodialis ATCC 42132]